MAEGLGCARAHEGQCVERSTFDRTDLGLHHHFVKQAVNGMEALYSR